MTNLNLRGGPYCVPSPLTDTVFSHASVLEIGTEHFRQIKEVFKIQATTFFKKRGPGT